jgi:hypothetical protein
MSTALMGSSSSDRWAGVMYHFTAFRHLHTRGQACRRSAASQVLPRRMWLLALVSNAYNSCFAGGIHALSVWCSGGLLAGSC